jgi:hypothetical protein
MCIKECEGDQCLRTPVRLYGMSALVWEIFYGPGRDQWTDGRYDYTLALKLFEAWGLDAPDIIEASEILSWVVAKIRFWQDEDRAMKDAEAEMERETAKRFDELDRMT